MVEVGDRGVVMINPYTSQFVPASTPDVGDRVIVIPMNDGSKFCIPCLEFSIGDYVWVGPEFKFAGFNWLLDWLFKLIPVKPPIPAILKSWILQTANMGTTIYYHSSVALSDDSIILMGGYTNNVYHSIDKGVSWHQHTTGTPWWSSRHAHCSVRLSDGSVVLMAGGQDDPVGGKEVWHSLDAGETWHQHITGTPWWSARLKPACVVMPDDSIILMGGCLNDVPYTYLNDVWRSTDAGTSWTQQTATAGWSARQGHSCVVLSDGSIILMGGIDSFANGLHDVWISTNHGVSWTRQTEHAEWSARSFHTSVVTAGDEIILMGGTWNNDVWKSTDKGVTWTHMPESVGWGGRSLHTSVILSDDSIVLAGGADPSMAAYSDVWRYA